MRTINRLALEWAERAFGLEHTYSIEARAIRLAEEAIEYAQATDVPKEQLHALIDYVYGKEKGHAHTELGQVALCVSVAAAARMGDPDDLLAATLSYVLSRDPDYFRERNERKNSLGFTGVPANSGSDGRE